MTPKLRRILIGTTIALLVAAGPIAFLDYFLPHHAVLRIVGAETRRPVGGSKTNAAAHDVFYVLPRMSKQKNPVYFAMKIPAGVSHFISNSIRPISRRWRNP